MRASRASRSAVAPSRGYGYLALNRAGGACAAGRGAMRGSCLLRAVDRWTAAIHLVGGYMYLRRRLFAAFSRLGKVHARMQSDGTERRFGRGALSTVRGCV